MKIKRLRNPLVLCFGLALLQVGCVAYPDGSVAFVPPPVVVSPVYAYGYGGGYRYYGGPGYGARYYGYRPYWNVGARSCYYGGGYRGGYYRGGYGYPRGNYAYNRSTSYRGGGYYRR